MNCRICLVVTVDYAIISMSPHASPQRDIPTKLLRWSSCFVNNGADLTVKGRSGSTILDQAEKTGNLLIKEYLAVAVAEKF